MENICDAIRNDRLYWVEALLNTNPNLASMKGEDDFTPLHVAAGKGSSNMAALLLANNADVHAKTADTYWRAVAPLHLAALKGHTNLVALLLANNADVNVRDGFGSTPLHFAADPSLLFPQEKANGGFEAVAELLLASKADVNAKDDDGRTPLYHAEARGNQAIADLLRRHGGIATTEPVDNEIHMAARDGKFIKVWHRIKRNPDRVFSRDHQKNTPLHRAVYQGHKRVVALLLANKAEVNARDYDSRTPLHLAAMRAHKDVAGLLLANGAKVDARDNGWMTPLNWAACNRTSSHRNEVVELLLARNANVAAGNSSGMTPLGWVRNSQDEYDRALVRLLSRQGA